MPLTPQGFEAYDITTLRAMFRSTYESQSGESPDWTEDTFFGVFSEAHIYCLSLLSQGIQQIWDAYHIDGATGRALDARAAEHLISRREATRSRALVDLTGTAGKVVPANKVVECTANNTRWRLVDTATLPASNVLVECVDLGPTPAPAGTLVRIVAPVDGWTGATNAAAATLGLAREGDGEFRARIIRSASYLAGRTAPALLSAVEALPFVNAAIVVNNRSPADVPVGAFVAPAHGHLLIVEPATLTPEERAQLAQVIFDTVGYGTQQGGSESEDVVYRGKAYPQTWAYATGVPVDVTATLTVAPGYDSADVQASAEDAVQTYFGTLRVGNPILLLGVYAALAATPGVVSASVLIGGSAADYAVAETEVALYGAGSTYPVV